MKNPAEIFHYTLMNKDTELIRFSLKNPGEEPMKLSDIRVVERNPYLDEEDLRYLIFTRKAPRDREYIDKVFKLMGINSVSDYLNVSLGLSLNDTLWFRPENCELSWADVNLYDDPFNETIARLALTGQAPAGELIATASPELATNGMLPKCWHRCDDGIYLMKGGTSGCSNTGNEPYAEYYASQLLKAMQMPNYVDYDLVEYEETLVSKCRLFTSQELGYSEVCDRFDPGSFNGSFNGIISIFDELKLRDHFNDLMCFDALIYNTDRHLNNYGFLVDNNTFEIVGAAPVFDNGVGLLSYYTMDKDIDEYAKKYDYQNSGLSFSDILILCLTDRQRKMLNRLVGFRFEKHPQYNWPDERLERVEELLQKRLKWILGDGI